MGERERVRGGGVEHDSRQRGAKDVADNSPLPSGVGGGAVAWIGERDRA
jgi:hypothetical protein